MRVASKKIPDRLKQLALARVLHVLGKVKKSEDMERVLSNFMTREEISAVIRRAAVAELREQGITYRAIEKTLGISRTTVSKVHEALRERGYSKNPNGRKMYKPLSEKQKKEQQWRYHHGVITLK